MSKAKINGQKISKKNNDLIHISDWSTNRLVFCDAEYGSVPNSKPPITYYKIPILTKNQTRDTNGKLVFNKDGAPEFDGSVGNCSLLFNKMFCFGVTKQISQETGSTTCHQMSFALWPREGPSEEETKIVKVIEDIIEKCKDHLLAVKKNIKKFDLERSDLKNLNKLLYWKTNDSGEKVDGQGPTISPKLEEFKERTDEKGNVKPYQMNTVFYIEGEVDDEGNPLEISPFEFLNDSIKKHYCHGTPVIKFESIYVGSKIAIQIKVTESDVQRVEAGQNRLLHRVSRPITSHQSLLLPGNDINVEEKKEENNNKDEKKEEIKPEADEKKKRVTSSRNKKTQE